MLRERLRRDSSKGRRPIRCTQECPIRWLRTLTEVCGETVRLQYNRWHYSAATSQTGALGQCLLASDRQVLKRNTILEGSRTCLKSTHPQAEGSFGSWLIYLHYLWLWISFTVQARASKSKTRLRLMQRGANNNTDAYNRHCCLRQNWRDCKFVATVREADWSSTGSTHLLLMWRDMELHSVYSQGLATSNIRCHSRAFNLTAWATRTVESYLPPL